jgi:hypothetical protein
MALRRHKTSVCAGAAALLAALLCWPLRVHAAADAHHPDTLHASPRHARLVETHSAPAPRKIAASKPAPHKHNVQASVDAPTAKKPPAHKPVAKSKVTPPGKAGKSSATTATKAKPAPRHGRKLRPEEEADTEPMPMVRTSSRAPGRAAAHGSHPAAPVRPVATQQKARAAGTETMAASKPPVTVDEEPSVLPHALDGVPPTGHHDRTPLRQRTTTPAGTPGASALTSDDFVRAAGATPAEAFATGESHPEDDERLPMRRAATRPAATNVPPVHTATATSDAVSASPSTLAPMHADVLATTSDTHTKVKKNARPDILPDGDAARKSVVAEAMTPPLPSTLLGSGRIPLLPPMKGTHEILVHQNVMADSEGLSRIQDDDDLDRMRAAKLLLPIAESNALDVNDALPLNRRYARPWTVHFVNDTARAFYARFHQALRLNSAVRTVAYQLRLQRVNGNAAGIDGEDASPHLTGQAIDFGKHGMTAQQIAWMRAYLTPLMSAGRIDVEEEFQQACFHISVYRSYVAVPRAKAPAKNEVAQLGSPAVKKAVVREDEPVE